MSTYSGTGHNRHASSMKRRGKRHVKTQGVRTVRTAGADPIKFMPEARNEEENGWQMRCEDVKSRIGMLFNCYTMSDVVFHVEVYYIPAHKFILGSASPVFHKQLYESASEYSLNVMARQASFQSDSGLSLISGLERLEQISPFRGPHTVTITDVPHLAFFEFLQFIYTDNVHITLDNVLMLIFLADTYKVAGLSDICFDFIRSAIVPHSVLRVIKILHELLLKAIVTVWRDTIETRKELHKFRQLSLAERRQKLDEMGETDSLCSSYYGSRNHSRRSSTSSRRSGRFRGSRANSLLGSSFRSRASSEDDEDDGQGSPSENENFSESDMDAAKGFRRKRDKFSTGFKGEMMKIKISAFVEELNQKCWKCIQEDTGAVISCVDMWEQDVTMLRKILRLDTCSAPEISLFRACHEWAQRQCKKSNLSMTAEHKRAVVGQETLDLIRFPTMNTEEFQWEVVPTGMLSYQDVQALLHSMTARVTSFGSSYNNKPRDHKTLINKSGELQRKPAQDVYSSATDDPLDCILGAELLKGFLKQTVDDQHGAKDGVPMDAGGQQPPSPAASAGRLPPITPRGSIITPRSSASFGTGPASPSLHRRAVKEKMQFEMVMGSRIDTEEQHDGIVVHGGGKRPDATDFCRLAPGFYKFRNEFVIELWLREGEAMVTNHGTNLALACFDYDEIPTDETSARAKLGIPFGKAQARGGVPLASFLCRQ